MEIAALEAVPGRGLEAPNPNLQSLPSWRCQDRPQTTALTDEVPGGPLPRRQEGDPGQPWQEDRRRRRSKSPVAAPAAPARARPGPHCQSASRPPGLDSQARQTEKRPLGIPTMRDRAEQALAKLALEPEWEARFEPNSYGFRPGRSVHDAIEAIHTSIKKKAKFALDADIAQCFDHASGYPLRERSGFL